MLRAAVLAGLVAMGGCSGQSAPPPPPSSAPPPFAQDAGPGGTPALPDLDPASGMDLGQGPIATPVAPTRPKSRAPRPIDITLKSTPPGAVAAVDGRPVGTTPTFWAGESDGLEHEFTFTRSGYASARYRFVPVTSGVLHVTLEAVAAEPPGGGLGPLIAPQLAPDAAVPPPPAADAAVRPAPPTPVPPTTAPVPPTTAPVPPTTAPAAPAPGSGGSSAP